MKYEILFDKPAQKFLLKQNLTQRTRLLYAINRLPYDGDIKEMKGYSDYYRLRVVAIIVLSIPLKMIN